MDNRAAQWPSDVSRFETELCAGEIVSTVLLKEDGGFESLFSSRTLFTMWAMISFSTLCLTCTT